MNPKVNFYPIREVAAAYVVSETTVKRWVRDGLLTPRYQIRSGRCCRLIFSEAELLRFAEDNFPTAADLNSHRTHSSKNIDRVRRIVNMSRLYAGKAAAAKTARLASRAYPSKR